MTTFALSFDLEDDLEVAFDAIVGPVIETIVILGFKLEILFSV